MTILVTGATGQLGSKVVNALLQTTPADQIAVSVRVPEKAEALKQKGIDVRQGDFDIPESLDRAFAGVDRLLLISSDGDTQTRIRQHANAIDAAKRAGVSFIAYTSLANAANSNLVLAEVHATTEAAILASGIPYSFLRNNWYLENEIGTIQGALAGAPITTASGNGKVGYAVRDDFAAAAAAVLAGSGHDNTIYELSGKTVTQDELAQILGEVIGKDVAVKQVSVDEYREYLVNVGLPEPVAGLFAVVQQNIADGGLDVKSQDFEKLIGRPATPLKEALAQIVQAL